MELEEAIKKLKKPKKIDLITLIRQFKRESIENFVVTRPEIIETLLNHITKQEKIIELMAEHIEDNLTDDICNKEPCYADEYINGHCQKCLECIKQYFEKEAEESE